MPKFLRAFLAATLAIASFGAIAQSYPGRPVKMLVGYAAGGGMDSLARVLAAKLTETLGQQVLVENRAGASGAVAADAMIKSLADGYTIYAAESGALILPAINPKISYDPVRNFLPVGGVATLPMAFVVTNAFPAKNAQELIAALKAAPGKYSYASPGVGTVQHFAFELFMRSAGVSAVHIPYKGAATMMPDIISGRDQRLGGDGAGEGGQDPYDRAHQPATDFERARLAGDGRDARRLRCRAACVRGGAGRHAAAGGHTPERGDARGACLEGPAGKLRTPGRDRHAVLARGARAPDRRRNAPLGDDSEGSEH